MTRKPGLVFLVLVPVVTSQNFYHTPCIPGWIQFGDKCYLYVHSKLKFDDAEAYCQRFRNANGAGHLVSVHSQQEMDFVNALVLASGRTGNYWIGLTDSRKEGEHL